MEIGMKILIVDDDLDIREMINEFFGYKLPQASLCFAENAFQALEIIEKISFDIIITDNYMPKMTGVELISRLKEKGCLPSLVIFFTSKIEQVFQEKVASLGARLVVKPTVIELIKALKEHAS